MEVFADPSEPQLKQVMEALFALADTDRLAKVSRGQASSPSNSRVAALSAITASASPTSSLGRA